MKVLRKIKFCAEDVWQILCCHKWKAIICALVALLGVVLGGVFVKAFEYSWWYENRCDYAVKLFDGGFGLFFSFFIWIAAYYVVLLACQLVPQLKYCAVFALFLAGFYCGANTAVTIIFRSVWGIFYALLVTLVEITGYFLSCVVCCCVPSACRTLREAYCDTKLPLAILAVTFVAKIVSFFVILRVLTAVI